jgi:hypothetical protein
MQMGKPKNIDKKSMASTGASLDQKIRTKKSSYGSVTDRSIETALGFLENATAIEAIV